MKKIVIISIIFVIMTGLAVWEISFSTILFNDIYAGLEKVEQSMNLYEEKNLDNPHTIDAIESVIKRWQKDKDILFCFGNTTLMRTIDEKLISLEAMIKKDHKDDAFVNLALTKSLIKGVENDTHPVPSNIL